ncbi:MAG: hypothetical protein J5969_08770 [Lachnospiraceae bacterium]|nr:hypothetical protein [Lachnospiraceae bacterium]
MAPATAFAETADTAKDVYIDNTVDESVSYVKAVVELKDTSSGQTSTSEVYSSQASVTYSNPMPSAVSGMISEAESTARSYAEGKGYTVTQCGMSTLTGKVWDNRKYTTVEDGDAVLIGDSDYLTGYYGDDLQYTRTHIASGGYGKETTYTITVKAEKSGQDADPSGDETPSDETPSDETPSDGGAEDGAPAEDDTPAEPETTGRVSQPHSHSYVWRTEREPSETEDGEMIYVCSQCGHIQYRVPVSAYYQFCRNTAERIQKAQPGAVIEVRTSLWISFHKIVLQALEERPDVTLKVSFLENEFRGRRLNMTIPAGTKAMSFADENGYAGFLFLAKQFGAAEE